MRSATRNGAGKDPAYLAFIRTQACVCCEAEGRRQLEPTEAAHVGLRGLSQKCSDRETIPLCRHHRTGFNAHHRLGRKFWEHFELDRGGLIEDFNERYELELARIQRARLTDSVTAP